MAKQRVQLRLYILIVLSAIFMAAEIAVGYMANSLALISDSFHMLSDVLALGVALWARRSAKRDNTERMTYGWRRAEVVGALANGVFLLALCLNIIIEAIQRFWKIEEITNPQLVLIIGGAGLAVNIIGLFLFSGHHGHSHSHGGHGHGHKSAEPSPPSKTESQQDLVEEGPEPPSVFHDNHDMNLRGVFLHVLGDALGSLAVIASSLIIWLTDFPQRYYIDPVISLFITALILKTTIPLVRKASKVLLQAVPETIDVKAIQNELQKVEDVINIHEIHIWQLSNNLLVASLHIACPRDCNFMKVATTLKAILHKYGIHATTIQPEFLEEHEMDQVDGEDKCLLRCETKCEEQSCCTKRKGPTLVELPKT